MADELLSLRIIVVAPSLSDRAMFREAAAAARVPIELVENDGETAGARSIALIAGSIRLRLPSRVLLVDDSPTMRSIVRKVLAATRFPLQVTEAGEGAEALALARAVEFDLVFFDYNLPGLSGLEAIAELRRAERHPDFVLMTSADDEALAEKARPGHRLSEKALLPGGFGKGAMRVLRLARAQSRASKTLLARPLDGEFAVVNARGEAFGVAGGRFLTVGGNELGQRQKKRRLRQAIAVNALMARVNPCFLQITERQSLLLVIGDGFLCRRKLRRNTH